MGEETAGLISAIAAVARNGMLGKSGWLPWDIPEELAYFEQTVAGAALVVGRLTYESMAEVPVDCFVVSRSAHLSLRPGSYRVATVEAGLRKAIGTGKPVFVIGGASVYAAAWPYCHRFYLTRIDADFAGDTCLPEEIPFARWELSAELDRYLVEKSSGRSVLCRFLQYRQGEPRAVPACIQSSDGVIARNA